MDLLVHVAVVTRVWVALSIVSGWEFTVNVKASFKVGKAFMKAPAFHVVFDPRQSVVFSHNFGNNCSLVDFEFHTSLMVVVVVLNFGIGCGIVECTGCLS